MCALVFVIHDNLNNTLALLGGSFSASNLFRGFSVLVSSVFRFLVRWLIGGFGLSLSISNDNFYFFLHYFEVWLSIFYHLREIRCLLLLVR